LGGALANWREVVVVVEEEEAKAGGDEEEDNYYLSGESGRMIRGQANV